MRLSRKDRRRTQLKTWSYKRCSKCFRNTKYENILDLYLLQDNKAIWICKYCQHPETIDIDRLLTIR